MCAMNAQELVVNIYLCNSKTTVVLCCISTGVAEYKKDKLYLSNTRDECIRTEVYRISYLAI